MILCNIIQDLIPILVCVVLPVAIVWLSVYAARFREAKRTEVLLKAIESGKDIDANMIANAMSKPHKAPRTPRERLNNRLTVGCVGLTIGIMLEVVLCIGRFVMNALSDEMFLISSMWNSILLGIGVAFMIVYFVTRKNVKD